MGWELMDWQEWRRGRSEHLLGKRGEHEQGSDERRAARARAKDDLKEAETPQRCVTRGIEC